MTEEIKQEKYTAAFDDLSDITHQLHNAFSKIFVGESEESDPHFSQLIKAGHLRVDDILTAPPVTTITSDIAIIRSAIYSYRGFAVVEGVVKPRGRHEQNSIVIRDLPAPMTPEEVIKLFTDIATCPTPASARSDVHNTWYVAFVSEDEAKAALAFIKSTSFGGKQIRARLKTDRNYNSPHNRDISNLDMNMNNVGMIPQPFSPAGYPQDPSMFFPGYIPHSPQYLYGQPMAPMFPPQFAPNGLYLDMNMAYPFAPLMYHPYYDPYSPNHPMMGYGNGRSPNRGGRSNRNSGRGYNNYSSRSRDQTSPRYQRNNNGYNSNTAVEGTGTEPSDQQNSHDNNQINEHSVTVEAAVINQTGSIDVNEESFEKAEVVTTEDEKVTTEGETVSPPSELSSKDQLDHLAQVTSNNGEVVEEGVGEASNESNKEEEDKTLDAKEVDRKDSKQRDRDRRNRDRRRKDRNDRSDSTRGGKEREKVKPPKLNMEVDFPSLNDDKAKTTQPNTTVEEKPTTQQTTVFNYANIVRKANPISSEPASTIPVPQPTKSNPVKESSPVASKNPPEATTNPVNFGVTLSQEAVKSSSQKPQDTVKADLPETSQNKTEPVAPLSFGAFSEPIVTLATKETISQSSSVKVEGTSSQSVIAESANDQNKADSVTAAKTGKKSFIDVLKQK